MKYFSHYSLFLFTFVFFSCSDFGEVKGCTDINACNYNSDATEDDGSCAVPSVCDTCEDNAVVDNDSDGDGVCNGDEVLGCTEPTACNFNANASDDDESCAVPDGVCDSCSGETDGTGTLVDNDSDDDGFCDDDIVPGCTDPDACNYNSDATNDDGSCAVPDGVCDSCSGETDGTGTLIDNDSDDDGICDNNEVPGCTDPDACNYNSYATHDDGSCTVPSACDTCEGNAVVTNGALGDCDTCVDDLIINNDPDDCGECGGDNSSCVNYSSEIQPIFDNYCGNCHLGNSYGGLNLSNYENVMAGGGSGEVIEPGDHDNSILWQRVANGSMPQDPNPDLSTEQINLIKQWINEGAQDN